ncbi:DNA-directed RNA polymerase subunit alpha [bacterium]|nr:DNA-directed RNA polymerase subunit alpha [bacterium]MBU1074356.1 DNA-directed RNA polymerase subunit alpha [bacterium]MBU1674819.1 DNA-directed RNA polymerase subunit alpha [bacterium]
MAGGYHAMKWINMMMPDGVQFDSETQTDNFAELVIAPLEKGFGHTLGTALRRTLLSSIHGHAITAVQIEGVKHELSTLPNVLEDVIDIVMNLKQVVFALSDAPAHWATLEASEPGPVTAGMIEGHPELKVMNPDHVICNLTESGNFSAKMYIDMGRGYVDREQHVIPDEVIGVIRLDANFSPIRKVSYRVMDTRVGQRTDYDKVVLGIESDGSAKPEDAVAFASKILKDHFQLFINFDEAPIDAMDDDVDEEQERLVELLSRNVEELELSVRSANCLKAGKILMLYDLVTKTEQEMLKFRNFGRKSLNEIQEILDGMDLSFGMSFESEIADRVKSGVEA